jgi:hypothetical protein
LGETSADELALKSGDESDKLDIVRTSNLSESYDKEKQMAAEVANYERKVIDEYHKLDLYRAKDKPRAKITFNDLTLTENLNYIKHNLKDSNEAMELFQTTRKKFGNSPEIAASLV